MKNILYVSRLCSPSVMEYIFTTSIMKPGQESQKSHRLLVEGFAMHKESCIVKTLSSIPITPISHKRRVWRLPSEVVGNIKYNYVPIINLPIVKNILVFIGAFFKVLLWSLRGRRKDKVVMCDVLNLSITSAALFACKLTGAKAVAIVTDLPNLMITSSGQERTIKNKLYNTLTSKIMSNYDGYILLTEQMNQVVNIHSKPYLIMEGLVDVNMANTDNLFENKSPEKILIYAGGIYEKYGVKKLIDAFMRLQGDDLRLHVYGPGEMAKDMPDYMKLDKRIVYCGIVLNKQVVKKQLEATLLVNPRSSKEEFTKYSFPCKNMESMVSGTPLVTTPLPGMPKEYYPFVYVFNDESVDGMVQTFKMLLAKPKEELHEFGQRAKEFMLTYKNNRIQAERVLCFFEEI
ncbi:MAG: glycosyltransferase [Sedimentisphaerales bacterium]